MNTGRSSLNDIGIMCGKVRKSSRILQSLADIPFALLLGVFEDSY